LSSGKIYAPPFGGAAASSFSVCPSVKTTTVKVATMFRLGRRRKAGSDKRRGPFKNGLFIFISVGFLLASCYTIPTSTVVDGVDFSQYEYAAIGSDVSGGAAIMSAYMQLQNSLISYGYKIIGDTRIVASLSSEDLSKLFIVTAGISSSRDE
jgi:hypothetical protein